MVTLVACGDDSPGDGTTETAGTEDDVDTSSGDATESSSDGTTTDSTDATTTTDSTDATTTDTTDATTTESTDTTDSTDTTGGLMGDDYAQPGPYTVSVDMGAMQVSPQCNLQYGVFTPSEPQSDTPLLLAHGFMRSIDDMAPTAEHIASWGVTVYTVPLCTNNFQINHQLNGEAMAALGQALAPNGAVYSGFSAGGLAAFVATANDPGAVAYVGLDPVDNNGLGDGLVNQVQVPVRAAVAEPGQCNTNNNFLPVLDKIPAAPVIRIVDAQHFDFETDACGLGDFGCSFCAPAGPQTRALALGMTTAGVLIETGADPGGATWWQPGGSYFDMYAQMGRIQLVQ